MAEPGAGDGQGNTGDGAGNGDTSYLDGIADEGLRANEALKDFENLDGLAKGFVDMKGSLPVLPADVKAYDFTVPKGIEVDEAEMATFKDSALKLGLTAEQYKGVMEFEFARGARATVEYNNAQKETLDALKKELGDGFDAALEKANKVLTKVPGGQDLLDSIDLKSEGFQ